MKALSPPAIRVSASESAPIGRLERGREGFLKLNMQLEFVNRSRSGQPFSVVAKSLGPVGIGRVMGTAASFVRARCHFADGRDLVSVGSPGTELEFAL